jgi:hypothetical protein
LNLNRREILRFAQNDTKTGFFRTLFSLWGLILAGTKTHRLKPVPLKPTKSIKPSFIGKTGDLFQAFPISWEI